MEQYDAHELELTHTLRLEHNYNPERGPCE